MRKSVKPSEVKGKILALSSKSVAQRAIAAATMTKGVSEILHPGSCDDTRSAIAVCQSLGAEIVEDPDRLVIRGGLKLPQKPLFCGEAGLGIRMFSAIAATLEGEVVLTGHGSLLKRPMHIIEDALVRLGAQCTTCKGLLPVRTVGPLTGGSAIIDGSMSSQVLTGLLMAAPRAQKDVVLIVNNLQSKPYIDITLDLMRDFGVEVDNNSYKEFHIRVGQEYQPRAYQVEGDWSGAAFMLVAGAIAGSIEVENLNTRSHQADRAILDALKRAGAYVSIREDGVLVKKDNLIGFDFDATHCPDLIPPLVALAACCTGRSTFLGARRLRVKESDRAAALQQEFAKLGITIKVDGDVMVVEGGNIYPADTYAHGDHRIAMAAGVVSLAGKGLVNIDGAESVAKSYPDFWDDLANISL
ncbi:MAG: 3-phosphoshikimate 1-carboxyvinyltransferase [Bacteroidales bacterium]|jgi:3-phosphoshikimate 1-carboxyvinyltransferase|nr:3-phosphoshikimate 1-carboxyvinyltransferase [Bacteroidales bacterium]MDD2264820.1 3-phosphoshikimate 1-carboxyvinyltransferase [Bacteroidales bacterium]MDD2832082.1 3-phosphoshikimate 1-carboxyvinyltransferase [Bacteroidales bacterium]MDD3208724.1 3-phosphoshikimate 1-carboxyvinyltransferase [Bacteroidales bacterium]MDD3697287.1 3-phosphoshikimate 1-carboxyvinyltransferase [Bacteroidales bacterium]